MTTEYPNFYIASHRSHTSYDKYLETGPYNFGFGAAKPDLVEHFAYQQGLMVSYWDTSQTNNNVSLHPGEGLNLYVDSHPKPILQSSGAPWRNRVQLYDAPFSLTPPDSFSLHVNGVPEEIKGLPAEAVFDDTKNYFDPSAPGAA